MSDEDRGVREPAALGVAGAVATVAVIGGVAAAIGGGVAFAVAFGADGLRALGFLGLGFGLLVLAGAMLIPGFVLRHAVGAIESAGSDRTHPTPFSTARAAFVALVVAGLAVSPAVSAFMVGSSSGPDAVPDGTEILAAATILVGLVSVAVAWTSRHLPGRPLGAALVIVALVPAVIPAWVTSQVAEMGANAQQAQDSRDRYADLADGPSSGEIVTAVGDVGSWRPVSGSMIPFVRSDDWIPDQGPVAELSGSAVRLLVLAQCRVERAPGQLYIGVEMRALDGSDYSQKLDLRLGPCDGELRSVMSDALVLPDWTEDVVGRALAGDYVLVGFTVIPQAGEGTTAGGETATRYVVYLSPDPPSAVDVLEAAVREAAGSFEIEYPE